MPLSNEVRIIGGKWKRRKLRFPDRPELRPTLDRVRVTLFNWLTAHLHEAVCLDLFAGSGALGFEALSRGARSVTFIERDPAVLRALKDNRDRLGATNAHIVRADALSWLDEPPTAATPTAFDLVFLDPPFATDALAKALRRLRARNLLTADARVYVELSVHNAPPLDGYQALKDSRAGETRFLLLSPNEVRSGLSAHPLSDTIPADSGEHTQ